MLITKKRLQILNNDIHQDKSINITDLYDEKKKPIGTQIELIIDFENLND